FPASDNYLVVPFYCTRHGRVCIPGLIRKCLSTLTSPPDAPRHGRPVSLLLPEFRLPRVRQTGGGNPDRDQPLRPRQAAPHAPIPYLQGPLRRAQGDTPVRRPPRPPQGRVRPGARLRGVRDPPDRSALWGGPQDRRPLRTAGRGQRPGAARRTRRPFPPGPVSCSSTRSGPTSPRR